MMLNRQNLDTASLSTQEPWQPIETAPKFRGTRVLLWSKRDGMLPGTYIGDDDWEADGGGLINPSHWMPLPSPPRQEPNR